MIRSQSMSLQIPVTVDGPRTTATPVLSPSSTCPSIPDNFPEYQRVTISGDYCAGVRSLTQSTSAISVYSILFYYIYIYIIFILYIILYYYIIFVYQFLGKDKVNFKLHFLL